MLYLSHDKSVHASYVVLFRFKKTPTAEKMEAIRDTLIKLSDNKIKMLSSNELATFIGFVINTGFTASGIKSVLDGATEIVYSACIDTTDEVFISEIQENAMWLGDEFHKPLSWVYRQSGYL